MIQTKRIQRRMFAIFGGLTVFIWLAYTCLSFVIGLFVEDSIIDKILAEEGRRLLQQYRQTGMIGQASNEHFKIYLDIQDTPIEVQTSLAETPKETEIFVPGDTHYHIHHLHFDQSKRAILLLEASPFLVVSNTSKGIIILSSLLAALILIIALLLAYLTVRYAVRPLVNLNKEVTQQKQNTQHMQLAESTRVDEIGELARTLQDTFNELSRALQREKDFTKDVGHELRTPLTIIGNTLQLANKRSITQEELKQIDDNVELAKSTVSTLLALARAESSSLSDINVRPVLEECLLNLYQRFPNTELLPRLNVPEDFTVNGNRELMRLIFTNLIENALFHGKERSLHIYTDEKHLIFENDVLANHIQESKALTTEGVCRSDGQGIGQGLYLVKRILEDMHWAYHIDVDNKRFRFVLEK